MIGTGRARAPQTSTEAGDNPAQMARSHLSQAPGRRPQRLTRCALALSIAEHGEDGVPPDKRRVSGRSWKSAAIRSAVLRVSATCALARDHPSSAARRAQESTSATRSAARPPLRSLSAASSGRLRPRGPRSTVDFIRAQVRYSAAGREEGVVATPINAQLGGHHTSTMSTRVKPRRSFLRYARSYLLVP